jgi:Transglutaminase-like superfamily
VTRDQDRGGEFTAGGRPAGRFAPSTLRAAGWTALSLRRARQVLRSDGVSGRIPFPPPLPVGATRGVLAVLRRTDPTCLERATVLQTWLAAHDQSVDIVVGVAADHSGVKAHAWIEPGTPDAESAQYREIHRIPPPT